LAKSRDKEDLLRSMLTVLSAQDRSKTQLVYGVGTSYVEVIKLIDLAKANELVVYHEGERGLTSYKHVQGMYHITSKGLHVLDLLQQLQSATDKQNEK